MQMILALIVPVYMSDTLVFQYKIHSSNMTRYCTKNKNDEGQLKWDFELAKDLWSMEYFF